MDLSCVWDMQHVNSAAARVLCGMKMVIVAGSASSPTRLPIKVIIYDSLYNVGSDVTDQLPRLCMQ